MRWHAELLIEAALFLVLCFRPAPRFFTILIGIDFLAGLLQILPYRIGLHAHSKLIWTPGVLLAWPLQFASLLEAFNLPADAQRAPHRAILAFWITAQLLIITLQTQHEWTVRLNMPLLGVDAGCFLAWICLYLL